MQVDERADDALEAAGDLRKGVGTRLFGSSVVNMTVAKLGPVHVRKSAFPDGEWPKAIKVTIEG